MRNNVNNDGIIKSELVVKFVCHTENTKASN